MLSSLKIQKPGPLSLIQDSGRTGFQHLGLAQGGAIDPYAYYWANHLLHNARNAACIEITLGPFTAEFHAATMISLTGANMHYSLNDVPVPGWQSHRIQPGDVLHCRPGPSGLRTYLAVAGGFISKKLFNSFSEVPREKLCDPQLSASRSIAYESLDANEKRITATPERYIPDYQQELILNVTPSYQHQGFSQEALDIFCQSEYEIHSNSDRMGYRLHGNKIDWRKGSIVSEGIALGSVQIPPDGQPIVLLNDRQTVGGYPKLGCVKQLDCGQLAQRRSGQTVRFSFSH